MCGEYGEQTKRPHYHAILFGHDFAEDRIQTVVNAHGNQRYLSPTLTALWAKGETALSGVGQASAAYVAKYTLKRNTADTLLYERKKDGYHWTVRPQYAAMSLRPGIGAKWLNKYHSDIYPSDETIIAGKRVRTPRYYDLLLQTQDANALANVKERRKLHARKNNHNTTTQRLLDYEELALLRQQDSKHTL